LDKVFAPMHRVDADKPGAPSSNLGLGLYISDRIVASHGGTIGVESSDEKGTTFTIRLPKRTLTMTTDDLVESKVKATDRMDRESVT